MGDPLLLVCWVLVVVFAVGMILFPESVSRMPGAKAAPGTARAIGIVFLVLALGSVVVVLISAA